jgi:hypothetical protein
VTVGRLSEIQGKVEEAKFLDVEEHAGSMMGHLEDLEIRFKKLELKVEQLIKYYTFLKKENDTPNFDCVETIGKL